MRPDDTWTVRVDAEAWQAPVTPAAPGTGPTVDWADARYPRGHMADIVLVPARLREEPEPVIYDLCVRSFRAHRPGPHMGTAHLTRDVVVLAVNGPEWARTAAARPPWMGYPTVTTTTDLHTGARWTITPDLYDGHTPKWIAEPVPGDHHLPPDPDVRPFTDAYLRARTEQIRYPLRSIYPTGHQPQVSA